MPGAPGQQTGRDRCRSRPALRMQQLAILLLHCRAGSEQSQPKPIVEYFFSLQKYQLLVYITF